MGMISKENYVVETNKNINKRIVLISDIHHDKTMKKSFYCKLLKKIEDLKPDYIVIAGDIIDCGKVLENESAREILEYFIGLLGSIARTIITVGNHDILYDYKDKNKTGNQLDWLKSLTKYPNIYYIYNETISINSIDFIHYVPSIRWYLDKNKDPFYNEFKRNPITINNNNNYKILISHSPASITKKINYENLPEIRNNINLILSGHMHSGMVFKFLEIFDFKKNGLGLISPSKKLFPKYCRGIHKIENMTIIISRGIRKIAKYRFMNFINILFSSEITIVDLK